MIVIRLVWGTGEGSQG